MEYEEIIANIFTKYTRHYGNKHLDILKLLFSTILDYQFEHQIIVDENFIIYAAIITKNYDLQCDKLKNTVKRELTIFEKAACLMYVTNMFLILDDRIASAKISLDMAYKMCEIPYNNMGEDYYTTPIIKKNMDECKKRNLQLILALLHKNNPLDEYSVNLEELYRITNHNEIIPIIIEPSEDILQTPIKKKKRRFNPFKK